MEFYLCKHCGNIVAYVEHKGVGVVCCGEEMQLIKPNTVDAAIEKHIPVVAVDNNSVTVMVGSTLHPMTEPHHIVWIALHTEQGNQRKQLNATGEPHAAFALAPGDKVISAYAYCNLHGLWMSA